MPEAGPHPPQTQWGFFRALGWCCHLWEQAHTQMQSAPPPFCVQDPVGTAGSCWEGQLGLSRRETPAQGWPRRRAPNKGTRQSRDRATRGACSRALGALGHTAAAPGSRGLHTTTKRHWHQEHDGQVVPAARGQGQLLHPCPRSWGKRAGTQGTMGAAGKVQGGLLSGPVPDPREDGFHYQTTMLLSLNLLTV